MIQVITGAFTILDMEEMVLHRGIANRSETDRAMFFISYSFNPTYKAPD
jgi:hypothetical protein